MSKKIFILLLVVSLVVVLFISCDNKEANTKEQSTPIGDEVLVEETPEDTGDPGFKDELPDLNFKGQTFTFLVNPDPAFRHFYDVNVEEDIGELINDTIYRRNRAVEERIGIIIKDVQDNNASKTIGNVIASGGTEYNGVWLRVDDFFTSSLKGIFANLHNVPHLNLEKKYWDLNAVNDMTISGKLYGITGDITTTTHSFTHLILFNKALAADYELPNMYNMVREGKWTFDAFNALAKDIYIDLNGNGKVDVQDFFSINITPAAYEAFLSSSGEKWVEKNANGEIVFSTLNEKKINVLNKIEEIFSKKDNVYCGYASPWPFGNGRAIFYDGDVGIMCTEMRDVDVDFGILPLPKFSEQQDRYYVYAYPFFPFLSIPTTIIGEDLVMAGAALEAIASESYRTLTPAFYETALESKFTRDEESYEMLDIILRSRVYDLLYWGQWDSFRNWNNGIVSALQKGNGGYVSTYEKTIEKSTLKIDEIVETYANLP